MYSLERDHILFNFNERVSMKNTRGLSLLIATTMVATMHAAENLQGRTQNLNIIKITENAWIELSAGKDDTQNILRDLARNSDNPNFELTIKTTIKPFAIIQEIERDGTDNISNDYFAMQIARLVRESNKGLDKKQGFIESLMTQNPEAMLIVWGAYKQKKEAEFQRNGMQFCDHNLKELLFSPDQDEKTAGDIADEKQAAGHVGAVVLKILFDDMKRDFIKQEEEKKEAIAAELQDKLGLEQK
jgi:hypothetical protein